MLVFLTRVLKYGKFLFLDGYTIAALPSNIN